MQSETNDLIQLINTQVTYPSSSITSPLCGVTNDCTIFYTYENNELIAYNICPNTNHNMWKKRRFHLSQVLQIVPCGSFIFSIQSKNPSTCCGTELCGFNLELDITYSYAIRIQPEVMSNAFMDEGGFIKFIIADYPCCLRLIKIDVSDSRKLPKITTIKCKDFCSAEDQYGFCEYYFKAKYSDSCFPPFDKELNIKAGHIKSIHFEANNFITVAFDNGFVTRLFLDKEKNECEILMSGFLSKDYICSQIVESLNGFMLVFQDHSNQSIIYFFKSNKTKECSLIKTIKMNQKTVNALVLRSIYDVDKLYAVQFIQSTMAQPNKKEEVLMEHLITTIIYDLNGELIKKIAPVYYSHSGEHISFQTNFIWYPEQFSSYRLFPNTENLIPSYSVCTLVHDFNNVTTSINEICITSERFEICRREIQMLPKLIIRKEQFLKPEDISYHNIYCSQFNLKKFSLLRTQEGVEQVMNIIYKFDFFDFILTELRNSFNNKAVDESCIKYLTQSVINAYLSSSRTIINLLSELVKQGKSVLLAGMEKIHRTYSQIVTYLEIVHSEEYLKDIKIKLRSIDIFKPFIAQNNIQFEEPLNFMPTIVNTINRKVFNGIKFKNDLFSAFIYSFEHDITIGILFYLYTICCGESNYIIIPEIKRAFSLSLCDGDRIFYDDRRYSDNELTMMLFKGSNRFDNLKFIFDKFYAIDSSPSTILTTSIPIMNNLLSRQCIEDVAEGFAEYCHNQLIEPTIISEKNGFSRSVLRNRPSEYIQQEKGDDDTIDRMKNFFGIGMHQLINTENGIKAIITCGIYLKKFKDTFSVVREYLDKTRYTQDDINKLDYIIPEDMRSYIQLDNAPTDKIILSNELINYIFEESYHLQRIIECYDAIKNTLWKECLIYQTMLSRNHQHVLTLFSILIHDKNENDIKNLVLLYLYCSIDLFKDEEKSFVIIQNEFKKYGRLFNKEITLLLKTQQDTFNSLKTEYQYLWNQKINHFIGK
ncbi:hypothetical protein EDI_116050 [Entamoeba dispar SAW760]|uniref:Uncharacterized protein n=1 Tax=Entamoeba dispar (strain ATCC PRA-260 / SAW760) TaxID=370354 RepID=B0EG68_ENTDS|nr:uncharacterized protein EDI_116050 [Entamoeba dispar SAW760]EDR26495.1 hypothetical protein EDI_116050 [Entamoeba dispar SAW760]|eukprot:EDR26495.1 hypothetical protein EDI_116050 [Entamoeba dispar SAW760]